MAVTIKRAKASNGKGEDSDSDEETMMTAVTNGNMITELT